MEELGEKTALELIALMKDIFSLGLQYDQALICLIHFYKRICVEECHDVYRFVTGVWKTHSSVRYSRTRARVVSDNV